MTTSDWQKDARVLLNNPSARISNDQRIVLERQASGMCLNCGAGYVDDLIENNDNSATILFKCGHRNICIKLSESISLRESIKSLVVPIGRGKKKFVFESIQGWFRSKNPRLIKGVHKERIIDKRNNLYSEKVINADDPMDIIKNQSQSLSDHQGHGSAKYKN